MQGKVIKNKMNKTVVVAVERLVIDPIYKKRVKKTSTFLVHTEKPLLEGQIVDFVETRPISKLKRFVVKEMLGEEKK